MADAIVVAIVVAMVGAVRAAGAARRLSRELLGKGDCPQPLGAVAAEQTC